MRNETAGWDPRPARKPLDGLLLSEIAGELLDIGAEKVHPMMTTEMVVSTSPSYTRITAGWIGEHGILLPGDIDRAIRIGVPSKGWADVARAITAASLVNDLQVQLGNAMNVQAAAWALQSHHVSYWPIRAWTLLPGRLVFSTLDVGHRVVITRGELMGQTGMVTSLAQAYDGPSDHSCVVKLKKGATTVLNSALAVLRDDDPAKLVPLAVLYPPGSPVWVRVRVRAGQQLTWVRATALQVRGGRLDVLMPSGEVGVCETRDDVEDGSKPKPPDGPVAQTSRGTNPAPRLRPRKAGGVRVRNVPPAS